MELTGFHHLTAISANIRENRQFYTQVLGLRLVKRSVNQDDVSAYHLFYADAVGNPGTDITFFDWPIPRERRGSHSLTRTCFRVQGRPVLEWWQDWLAEQGVETSGIVEQDGRLILEFEDPEGQRLGLVDDAGQGDPPVSWEESPVPAEYQLRGLGPIMMSVPALEATDAVLTQLMNMRQVRQYGRLEDDGYNVYVYQMGGQGPQAELHVAVQPDLPVARQGAGGVHHVAFRTPNAEEQDAWLERVRSVRLPNSGIVDRFWFRSIYFREPNGVLFEVATDGPGFDVDEDMETLGEKLILPPWLEAKRDEIEANLKPID